MKEARMRHIIIGNGMAGIAAAQEIRYVELESGLTPATGGKITLSDAFEEPRNVYLHRTLGDAQRLFALETSLGFFDCGFRGISQRHLVEIMPSNFGRLFRHLSSI